MTIRDCASAKYIDVLVKQWCNAGDATNGTPFVDSDALASEWKYCSLMIHGDRTISLPYFCKLLVTTSQYVAQYPNLVKIAFVTLIVPAISVECERSFSCQNCIKTKLRSPLKNPTLDRLVRVAYSKGVSFILILITTT